MARSRNIKPGFAKNEYLAQKSHLARLLFVMLPTIADREGRLEDRPLRIKGELFPYEQIDVDALLDELSTPSHGEDHPFISRYEIDGSRYIQITKFDENQNPHKEEKPSGIPPCNYDAEHHTTTVQPPCKNGSSTEVASDTRLKVKGIKLKESELRESEKRHDDFDAFWQSVPNKTGKVAANKAFDAAVKNIRGRPASQGDGGDRPQEFLIRRMKLFAESDKAKGEFCPHPATWLNQGRYDDDEDTWRDRAGAKSAGSRTTNTEKTGSIF